MDFRYLYHLTFILFKFIFTIFENGVNIMVSLSISLKRNFER